ncbi:MAG: hypothetical protein HOC91_01035 [Nitrospinaceae bacterium]|nr:hypothetical protein [Nitrospinaceae bacterium]MBT3821382.1 hypothetical protein [Nitrospinaceae bacterium]MBT4093354.1 hypothetical protein [Nitrospinaceae bacterium]MBT4429078.1 hypothetical protein [Nitrospinaceae bacterium]MBT5368490.1 hypothetical protein [Nitrospinaceae bacterium]
MAAAEAANSAVAGADLIPTLTLGIPGSGTTAILMGAFIAQGLRPGPLLFQEHGSTVYAIFTLLLLGNPITLLFGSCLTGVFARFVTIRRSILFPSVLLLSTMGVYMNQNDLGQVFVAVLFGLLGYIMRKMDYAIAPLVIAFIITPTAERSLKQALIIADGELSVFVTRPISALFLLLSVLVCVSTIWRRKKAAA